MAVAEHTGAAREHIGAAPDRAGAAHERAGAAPDRASAGAAPADREPTVIADSVHVTYTERGGAGRTPHTVHAVKGVSFAAYRGEAIGLIGSNGSGKSTLLKAVAGLLPTSEGRIYTRGHPALLGVNAALMGDLTGERNVILGGLAMGMSRKEIGERYAGIVEFSGINDRGDFVSLPMRTYSSGMGARLRFSIAAARSHDVLLIDEALATGDARFRRRSQRRIDELRAEAGTVFLVSHSNSTITETCDRALWLEAGTLRRDGPADEVVAAYEEFTSTDAKTGKN
ncbi:ABC transporter ATP-binding protein [Streptomyces sp. 2RAF24]|uniref:ABC transporter ATP-binding protein n=1 Tax=Streptomyces sp. 2RAF24 TaxID=3232997 RepID=UPI003F97B8DE